MTIPAQSLPESTNRHYLKALADMADTSDIVVAEDVYGQNGMKIMAKGSKVSSAVYERVVQHKLARPLESAIVMRDAPGPKEYALEGERLMDELPIVRTFCGWSNGQVTPIGMLQQLHFNPAASTVLAVAHKRSEKAMRHDVLVAMMAMGVANAFRYNDQQILSQVAQGGLFHDVGEAYIDPRLLNPHHEFNAQEWLAYSAHPVVAAALAREIAGLDQSVQRAVLEHHERLDGCGYPRAIKGGGVISPAGNVLAIANLLSGLALQAHPSRRIAIALKFMPGEFPPELVSLSLAIIGLAERFSEHDPAVAKEREAEMGAAMHDVFGRIARVLQVHDELSGSLARLSPTARALAERSFERFVYIQKAFASTGVAELSEISALLGEEERGEIHFEASCVLDEISHRLRALSRELMLKAMAFHDAEVAVLRQLADAMLKAPEPIRL